MLADVSLTLEVGGFYVLTGGGGAGKTTLVDIVTLGAPASGGKLALFGGDVAGLDRAARARLRRRIGIVFQNLRLIDELSAHDNVALPLRIAGATPAQIASDVGELLAWLGIADRAARPAATLASSERRLVALARAIVGRPELLVADEPIGDADLATRTLLEHAFEQVNRLGTTVLVATQSERFARLAAAHYALDGGRLAPAAAAP